MRRPKDLDLFLSVDCHPTRPIHRLSIVSPSHTQPWLLLILYIHCHLKDGVPHYVLESPQHCLLFLTMFWNNKNGYAIAHIGAYLPYETSGEHETNLSTLTCFSL